MISISDNKVLLRDFIESDIPQRICWETTQTEWQLWDAPWEYESLSDFQKQKDLAEYIEKMEGWVEKFKIMPDTQKRSDFQICTRNNNYVGWCTSYKIDDEYNYSLVGLKHAIGIDIPEISHRGNGYAFHALCLFIDYLTDYGIPEIYTQTWSGNVRMIALATKLGFEECCRKSSIRMIRKNEYDGLTFHLNRQLYEIAKQKLLTKICSPYEIR